MADTDLTAGAASPGRGGDAREGTARGGPALSIGIVAVVTATLAVLPVSARDLGTHQAFVPAVIALVGCLDLLSALLLLRQFRDSGDRRCLALASAYLFALAVLAGYAAAFPGVLADVGPLGGWPSTAPWLWVAWHTGFPVLLAAAVAPWRARWQHLVPPARRRQAMWATSCCFLIGGAAVVAAAVTGRSWLPVLIHGHDTTAMTRITAPVVLPLVAVATVVAVLGATRASGPLRWTALACVAALGDVVLTELSYHRFSLGWYVGRSLTVVSSAVVLTAMLVEFGRLKHQLAEETERLRAALARTEQLEGMRSLLLNNMSDGVMLQDAQGHVVAANPATLALLGLSMDQLAGREPLHPEWGLLRTNGQPWPVSQTPDRLTLATGEPQRDRLVGVRQPGGARRWLRVNTAADQDQAGAVRFVVSSMTDETDRHAKTIASLQQRDERRHRVQAILDHGGPEIVVQPIVDLRTGRVAGGEALSRFPCPPAQGPDRWFADAAEVGLGTALELSAVAAALCTLAGLPGTTYLSINVSPATATTPELFDLLGAANHDAGRVVLELTEHTDMADFAAVQAAIAELRTLGVRVAVDDTGSGYASLTHILNLRPDVVKLDLALVRDIHTDPARRALATGLLIFATEIGACLVAEGIETERELRALREIGVTHGQGYHLGRPAPLPMPRLVPLGPAPATTLGATVPGRP